MRILVTIGLWLLPCVNNQSLNAHDPCPPPSPEASTFLKYVRVIFGIGNG